MIDAYLLIAWLSSSTHCWLSKFRSPVLKRTHNINSHGLIVESTLVIHKVDTVEMEGRRGIVRETGNCGEDGQLRDFQSHVGIRGPWHKICIT